MPASAAGRRFLAARWAFSLLCARAALALHNGVSLLPQLGWSSWNTFRCEINSALILETADAMVSSGLLAAGYEYVNVDDCWMLHDRDAAGHLVVDVTKFPEGMKWLGDALHKRGLKFGIYSAAGNKTCEGYAASWGHEDLDAADFASWGVVRLGAAAQATLTRPPPGPRKIRLLRLRRLRRAGCVHGDGARAERDGKEDGASPPLPAAHY